VGRLEDAISAYQKAVELDPVHSYNLKRTLEKLGRLDLAVSVYKKLSEIHPESATIWRDLAEALKNADRLEEAILAYKKAAELDLELHLWDLKRDSEKLVRLARLWRALN